MPSDHISALIKKIKERFRLNLVVFSRYFSRSAGYLVTHEGMMKTSAIISICLTFLLSCLGCSREEPTPPPVKKYKVVMPIKKPVPKKAETTLPSKKKKTKEETKEATEVKTAAIEEKTIRPPETEIIEKKAVVEELTGYYIVKKGDSLSSIAGRDDVYGDPLKWPILYRLNMDKLDTLQVGEDFLESELSEGVRLKIITPDEAKENLERRLHNVWVVNVLSATTNEKIIPVAIRLIKNGYPVYITRATVKGKDWMRLRVGFFENKTDANIEEKKIMALLKLGNSWVTKIAKELEEFGGY